MIELEKWEELLIDSIESDNCTTYEIKEYEGKKYISKYDLMCCLEDTRDYRRYADEKVYELSKAIDKDSFDDIFDKYYRAEGSLKKALNKIQELEEKIDRIQSTLDEDDYDKLAEEGIEL